MRPRPSGGYGFNQYRVVGTFREPRAFDTLGDAQLSAYVERGIRSSFNFDRRGVRAEYARRFPNRLVVLGRYAYDYTELFDAKIAVEDQLLIDRLFPQVRLSTLFGSVVRDSRNDVLDHGARHRGRRRSRRRRCGSSAPRSASSRPSPRPSSTAGCRAPGRSSSPAAPASGWPAASQQRVPRLDAAGQPVFGDDGAPEVEVVTDLPASERFFAGGDTTVRGFALDRLGTKPRSTPTASRPAATPCSCSTSSCARPYVKGVAWSGSSTPATSSCAPATRTSASCAPRPVLGIRYRSPLGPLRFDVGFKLDRQDLHPRRRAPRRLPPLARPGLLRTLEAASGLRLAARE